MKPSNPVNQRGGKDRSRSRLERFAWGAVLFALLVSSCSAPASATPPAQVYPSPAFPTPAAQFTPVPTRGPFSPGELVDYIAQTGDTLPALAARFNTSIAEIRSANPVIPQTATTMPPGMPMKIPIYNRPLWGTPYQILPDSLFVNGPAVVDFNTAAFINNHPGWLKDYTGQLGDGPHSGAEIIDLVAQNFSVSPRVLLATLEYFSQALSNPAQPGSPYVLGYVDQFHEGLYLQLVWLANTLNNGYYGWRRGTLLEFETPDTRIVRPDPWQNAATVAFQYAFSRLYPSPTFDQMIGPGGLAQTYTSLFGDPWANVQPHIPASLEQPALLLPMEPGKGWNLTGGPHTGWGAGEPLAAIDFAPNGVSGCGISGDWVTAMADGLIDRSDNAEVILDLDGDGKEQTGWVIFYLHLADEDRIPAGRHVRAGDRIGHPSCLGGETTGTHVHIARKYNGEWMLADWVVPFNLEGWVLHDGDRAYLGTMTRFSQTVIASDKSVGSSSVHTDRK